LNQNSEHNDEGNPGDNPDQLHMVHIELLSLLVEKVLKRVRHGNYCRTQGDEKQAWEYEKYQREDQFDGRLRRLFLHLLNALCSQSVGMSSQSL
jgi:hypothetical protein